MWLDTLRHFRSQPTDLLPEEQELIARSIQRWGKNAVIFALKGKRLEKKDDRYDPADHLSLKRVLNHRETEKFEDHMNRGVRGHNREASA